MEVHRKNPERYDRLKSILHAPSFYDLCLQHLARQGFAIPQDYLQRDWSQAYVPCAEVEAAWAKVYAATGDRERAKEQYLAMLKDPCLTSKAILNIGPAIDIRNSWLGFSGKEVIAARPPIGRSVISFTSIPNFFATTLCVSSCRVTHKNTKRIKNNPLNP